MIARNLDRVIESEEEVRKRIRMSMQDKNNKMRCDIMHISFTFLSVLQYLIYGLYGLFVVSFSDADYQVKSACSLVYR